MNESTPILACPPISAEALRRIGLLEAKAAPYSVQMKCQRCGEPVWVGPRQQLSLKHMPEPVILCFECIARSQTKVDEVRHLGGTSAEYRTLDGKPFKPERA